MVVHLQRELLPRVDHDPLDLEPLRADQRLVRPPGSIHRLVQAHFRSVIRAQAFDQPFDILYLVRVRHQHGIRGFDDHQVFHAHGGQQARFRAQVAVPDIVRDHVALGNVAGIILLADVAQGRPRTDIVPVTVERNHGGARSVFHHRIIHRIRGAATEGFTVHPDEVQVVAGFFVGIPACLENGRGVGFQFFQVGVGAKQENAAVPEVFTAVDIVAGGFRIGFLGEMTHRKSARIADRIPPLYITVAGFGARGRHAERDQVALGSEPDPRLDRGLESLHIANHVVGR